MLWEQWQKAPENPMVKAKLDKQALSMQYEMPKPTYGDNDDDDD